MSELRFAAWGSIDIDGMERIKRRSALRRIRKELEKRDIGLDIGGRTDMPHYRVIHADEVKYSGRVFREAAAVAVTIVDAQDAAQNKEKANG